MAKRFEAPVTLPLGVFEGLETVQRLAPGEYGRPPSSARNRRSHRLSGDRDMDRGASAGILRGVV